MARALPLLLALVGCSAAAPGPDPVGTVDEALSDAATPAREASAPTAPAPTGVERYAQLGDDCAGTLGCEANPYEGPEIDSWACYAALGNRCAFRCDECPPGNDAGAGACQVAYLQTAPPVCAQLGGHCVASAGLDGGAVSLCVR